MPSRPAAISRGTYARPGPRSTGPHQGSSTTAATPIRTTSNGSGASCRTRARVATGAMPQMATAASPAVVPAPEPVVAALARAHTNIACRNGLVQFNHYIERYRPGREPLPPPMTGHVDLVGAAQGTEPA